MRQVRPAVQRRAPTLTSGMNRATSVWAESVSRRGYPPRSDPGRRSGRRPGASARIQHAPSICVQTNQKKRPRVSGAAEKKPGLEGIARMIPRAYVAQLAPAIRSVTVLAGPTVSGVCATIGGDTATLAGPV